MNTNWSFKCIFLSVVCAMTLGTVHAQTVRVSGSIVSNITGALPLVSALDVVFVSGEEVPVQYDSLGNYYFDVPVGSSFDIKPRRIDRPQNGVNIADVLTIQRYILFDLSTLDSPYKLIAADVNNSKSITVSDLVEIRSVLMNGISFSNNTSWRFVPSNYQFTDPMKPLEESFPEFITIQNIQDDISGLTFIPIKVGDVNNSVVLTRELVSGRNRDVKFITQEQNLKAGSEYRVEFRSEDMAQMEGYQYTMQFNPNKLGFVGYEAGLLDLIDEDFGFGSLDEGRITSVWYTVEPMNVNASDVLFTLIFKALSDADLSDVLEMSSDGLEAMAVREGVAMGLNLVFEKEKVAAFDEGYALFQNAPNPFTSETNIGFTLPRSMHASFSVFDVSGRLLKIISGDFAEGLNTISLKRSELPASGLLYYQLEAGDYIATKKMLLVD